MENPARSNSRAERYSFTSAAVSVGAVVLLIGIAPRNERALFLRDAQGDARAFAAVVPPLDAARAQLERGALDDIALRSARSEAAQRERAARGFASSGTQLMPGTVPALLSNAPRGSATDGIADPAAPGVANAADPGVVAPAPTGGEAPGGGGGGVAPPGVTTPPPGGTGANVLPEPGTWAMMLLGFLAIGGVLRRPFGRRAGAIA
ncbi:PEPxxWA-CTERM sorting domain-containing protein [Sphingomonas sp. Leaf357]|uniref:PEPxxWA-CTERM sorting domain-containing protein n=1 Tax=Sphingomonas sp. Leaf357 TaxID=1736350 RepID=UPI0012E1C536|nr:PEPxxWA-CTERM sorting domain-containing protein [Sphingomonas sp. Leaf357]